MSAHINNPISASPFHRGEKQMQAQLGVSDKMEKFARRVVRDHMPEQHRAFYQQLPFILAGHIDDNGHPWASFIQGADANGGFIHSPNDKSLTFTSQIIAGDPLQKSLTTNRHLGLLGIELPTRRRNRLSTRIASVNEQGFNLEVIQAFGNCPQYIQTRELERVTRKQPQEVIAVEHLTDELQALITNSDTFFVASHYQDEHHPDAVSNGADISHRGGKPGFIRVDNNHQLTIPDYLGNFHFNTLGNFLLNPKAGLLFVDFEHGHILTLTGTVSILVDDDSLTHFDGAERLWTFTLTKGFLLKHALPYRWQFGDYSPSSNITGTWQAAQQRKHAEQRKNEWQSCVVKEVIQESDLVKSFYLQVNATDKLPFKAGQFLTIKIPIENKTIIRTYTLSNAPGDNHYRISVKRESHGLCSQYLHDKLSVGDVLPYKAPNGSFHIAAEVPRPAVLIAGGIGITPMIAMMRHVLQDSVRTRSMRPLILICAVKNLAQRSFYHELQQLVAQADGYFSVYWVLSQPEAHATLGRDFHHQGYITAPLLQQLLPLDDYDFYLCGPAVFMQAIYDLCLSLGVNDHRIMAESFGPASLQRQQPMLTKPLKTSAVLESAQNAIVNFSNSEFEQAWSADDNDLLTFAESHGLSPEHGCRNGQCGACKVPLLSGKVSYLQQPRCDYNDNEVVICCAVPANDQHDDITKISIEL